MNSSVTDSSVTDSSVTDLRTKALKKARNVFKTHGAFRKNNRNKKKCLCAVGVLADCAVGIEPFCCPDYSVLAKKYGVSVDSLVSLATKNDTTNKSLTVLLKEFFKENKVINHDMLKGACASARAKLLEHFPDGIPVNYGAAEKLATLNLCAIDLGYFPCMKRVTSDDVSEYDRLLNYSKPVPVDLVLRLLELNYKVLTNDNV